MERVVVSAMNILSRAGNDQESYWKCLNGEGTAELVNDGQLPLPAIVNPATKRRTDRFSLLALTSSILLWENSCMNECDPNLERVGSVFNSAFAALGSNQAFLHKLITLGPDLTSPIIFSNTVSNAGVGHVCIQLGLKGASTMLMGSSCVGYAFDVLRANRADALVVGGAEAYNEDIVSSFERCGFIDLGPYELEVSRPLDRARKGIRICEGAATMMLETLSHAQKRGISMYAEVLGCGATFSPISPERAIDTMDHKPFQDCMEMALSDAGVRPDEIDGIVMAAGGSYGGDLAEARAIHETFTTRAAYVPVTTHKGLTGETGGASSTIGILTGVLAIAKQILPPAIGFHEQDEEVGLHVVRGKALPGKYNYILVNGYDIGGNISSVVLKNVR